MKSSVNGTVTTMTGEGGETEEEEGEVGLFNSRLKKNRFRFIIKNKGQTMILLLPGKQASSAQYKAH